MKMNTFDFYDIEKFCGSNSFQKGQKISDDFIQLFVLDKILSGIYPGSVGVYKINIEIKDTLPPNEVWCTCPAMSDYPGPCKHIAALLINWVKSKNNFFNLSNFVKTLQNKSKEELIDLIIKTSAESIDATNYMYAKLFGEFIIDPEYLNNF